MEKEAGRSMSRRRHILAGNGKWEVRFDAPLWQAICDPKTVRLCDRARGPAYAMESPGPHTATDPAPDIGYDRATCGHEMWSKRSRPPSDADGGRIVAVQSPARIVDGTTSSSSGGGRIEQEPDHGSTLIHRVD